MGKHGLTSMKARKILRHGSVHGKKLSPAQKRLFGVRASGKRLRRA